MGGGEYTTTSSVLALRFGPQSSILFISLKITKQNILQKDEAVSLQLKIPLLKASAYQLLN